MAGCGSMNPRPHDLPICCNSSYYPLVLISGERALRLDGLDCHGDESRACCNLAANGERVIATGALEHEERGPEGWVLRGPELCVMSE